LGDFVALSSRRLQNKEYIDLEEEHDEEEHDEEESLVEEESDVEDSNYVSEESDEEEIEDFTWTDADGNPIVSVKEE